MLGNVFVIMVVWVLVAMLVASAAGHMVNRLLVRFPSGVLRIAVGVGASFFLVNLVLLWISQAGFARTPWWALFPGGLFANAMVLKRLWDAVGADAASAKPFSARVPRAAAETPEAIDSAQPNIRVNAATSASATDGAAAVEEESQGGMTLMDAQPAATGGSWPRQSQPDVPMPGPNTATRPMAQRVKFASVTNADDSLPSAGASAMPGKVKKRLFGPSSSARAQDGDGADAR